MNTYRISTKGHVHLASAPCRDGACSPVVVISPEDREAVDRLVEIYIDHIGKTGGPGNTMQAALREFANPKPPRPDEPQLFSAAVRDSGGRCWTRAYQPGCGDTSAGEWYCGDMRSHYADITAVRVLSPGVEVDQ